jgi:hypothetical protein
MGIELIPRNSPANIPYTEVHYVLNNGTEFTINDKDIYERQKHLFMWMNENEMDMLIRRMTGNTELNHRSIITINEDGRIEYNINLPLN